MKKVLFLMALVLLSGCVSITEEDTSISKGPIVVAQGPVATPAPVATIVPAATEAPIVFVGDEPARRSAIYNFG